MDIAYLLGKGARKAYDTAQTVKTNVGRVAQKTKEDLATKDIKRKEKNELGKTVTRNVTAVGSMMGDITADFKPANIKDVRFSPGESQIQTGMSPYTNNPAMMSKINDPSKRYKIWGR